MDIWGTHPLCIIYIDTGVDEYVDAAYSHILLGNRNDKQQRVLISYTSRELLMRIDYLSTTLRRNMDIAVLTILASLIIIFGGIAI